MNATISGELFHSAGSPITEWHYIIPKCVNIWTHSDVYLEREMPLALSLPLVNQQKNSPARNPNEIRNINSLKYHRIRLHLELNELTKGRQSFAICRQTSYYKHSTTILYKRTATSVVSTRDPLNQRQIYF